MRTLLVAVAVVAFGCKTKPENRPPHPVPAVAIAVVQDATASDAASTPDAEAVDEPDPETTGQSYELASGPPDFSRWDMAARRRALAGGWVMFIGDTPSIAMEIHGSTATISDPMGERTHAEKIALLTPCGIDLDEVRLRYAVVGGSAWIGRVERGERNGNEAVFCRDSGLFILDAKGGCTEWVLDHDPRWRKATCGLRDGASTFFYVDFGKEHVVSVSGNLIIGEDDGGEIAASMPDYASALEVITTRPSLLLGGRETFKALARTAGGTAGDTTSLANLVATVTDTDASWDAMTGRRVTTTGVFLARELANVEGKDVEVVAVGPARRRFHPNLECFAAPGLRDLAPYDAVTISGKIRIDNTQHIVLDDCTIARAGPTRPR